MIEGKLGHHFQVDEMRHIASTACPAFTACRSAERCCCPCTSRPPCPAFTAHKKGHFGWSCFQPRLGAQPAWFMLCTKELERAQTQDSLSDSTFSSWWSLHCRVWMLGTEHVPSSPELVPKGPIRNSSSTKHCPASHKWQTMQKHPHLEECDLGPSISTNFQRYPASKQVTQSSTHSRSSVLGRHSSSVPISKDTAEPTLLTASNHMPLGRAAFKHLI